MPGITYNFFDLVDLANTRELWVKKLIELAAIHKNIFLLASDAQVPGIPSVNSETSTPTDLSMSVSPNPISWE
jgi:hypothetical protein